MIYKGNGYRRDGAHVIVGTDQPLAEDFVPSGAKPRSMDLKYNPLEIDEGCSHPYRHKKHVAENPYRGPAHDTAATAAVLWALFCPFLILILWALL